MLQWKEVLARAMVPSEWNEVHVASHLCHRCLPKLPAPVPLIWGKGTGAGAARQGEQTPSNVLSVPHPAAKEGKPYKVLSLPCQLLGEGGSPICKCKVRKDK